MQDIKASSQKKYSVIIKNLEKEYQQAMSIPPGANIDPDKFVLWCIESSSNKPLSNAYRSLIRAALIHKYSSREDGREAAVRALAGSRARQIRDVAFDY